MAKEFTELVAWQLARELKLTVYELVKHPKMARDFKFIDQITDAAASAPRNIAEGFGRFNRKEFAQYLKIAISSEQEVRNHVIDAFDRGYIDSDERDRGIQLSRRAITAAARLRRYLLSDRNPFT
jgi:four helix bundle protein